MTGRGVTTSFPEHVHRGTLDSDWVFSTTDRPSGVFLLSVNKEKTRDFSFSSQYTRLLTPEGVTQILPSLDGVPFVRGFDGLFVPSAQVRLDQRSC